MRCGTPAVVLSFMRILMIATEVGITSENALEGDPEILPSDPCYQFKVDKPNKMEFSTPNFPENYTNMTDCTRILEAEAGHILTLDFRDTFDVEGPVEGGEECRFDYLEVRDGAHGYSNPIGVYCGSVFPPLITSSGRFLWLRFKTDDTIEKKGFRAVYSQVPKLPTEIEVPDMEDCRYEKFDIEGFINRSEIDIKHLTLTKEHGVPLDCMWVIRVQEGWKIQLNFNEFQLAVPNDCVSNFVDIFAERTDIPSRLYNFCGSMAELVNSPGNILQLRFFAEPHAVNSNFEALFTAFRDKPKGNSCEPEEYDCEDGNCISAKLKCNGRINCRFRWDEDVNLCQSKQGVLFTILNAEHMIIILVVFFLILTGMCFAFLFNCFKKLIRDHRTIQEHMRMSREGRLEEFGKNSSGVSVVGGSREECYVPEMMMVDSQCQTRESLFSPPPPPPPPPPLAPPAPHHFTTFGYSPGSSEAGEPRATSMESTKSAPDVIMSH